MLSNSEEINNNSLHNTCPHLGLSKDTKSFSAYPSARNVCHHVSPISTPAFIHQQKYCLSSNYLNCPIYNNPSGQKIPKSIKSYKRGFFNLEKRRKSIVVISAVIVIVVTGIIINSLPGIDLINFVSQPENTPQRNHLELNQNISQTHQKTATNISSIETITKTYTEPPPTPTQMLTSTPTKKDPVLALDTPIGDENQFIIHRVKEGESLQIFANLYNTSVDAIRAVNYDLIAPLWIDWLVIIPLNTTEVSDIPTFEPYQVETENIALKDLSEELSIPLEDLVLYNNLDAEHVLHQGEWLLIPKERPVP